MVSRKPTAVLKRVTGADVSQWLLEGWPDQANYPDASRCHQVAIRVNAIVDRHNASRDKGAAADALKKRRQDVLAARRQARALAKALQRTLDNLRSEPDISTISGLAPIDGDLAHHISVTTQALTAVESLLGLPEPPRFQDHADPILWIARAVKEAWGDLSSDASAQKSKVRLNPKPEGPLVSFIQRTLEAIGWASDDQAEICLDTISDHLRQRQNRPRLKRGTSAGVGEK